MGSQPTGNQSNRDHRNDVADVLAAKGGAKVKGTPDSRSPEELQRLDEEAQRLDATYGPIHD
jgi:hypothetical protein